MSFLSGLYQAAGDRVCKEDYVQDKKKLNSFRKELYPDRLDLSKRLSLCTNETVANEVAGVYITTNENKLEESRERLSQKPLIPNSCHIGFAGWHNFNIMAMRRSASGLICDFNPKNKRFINMTLMLLKSVSSREDFIRGAKEGFDRMEDKWFGFFSPNVSQDLDGQDILLNPSEEIEQEVHRRGSWLSNDESFTYIQNLALAGQIVPITEDIRNTATFEKIAAIYASVEMPIDTVYVSNICDYMEKDEDKKAYVATMHRLLQPQTTLIHCPTFFNAQGNYVRLQQEVISSKKILTEDEMRFFRKNDDQETETSMDVLDLDPRLVSCVVQ